MIFSRAIVAVFLAASAAAQSVNSTEPPFALQSPGQLIQCKNTTIVWQGGKSPYKVTIRPTCDAGKNATEEVHAVLVPGSTSIELPIAFPANTTVTVSITDSTNMQATAPPITIESGDANDACGVQTTCTANIQAPNAPIALASDHLLTSDPSATSSPTPGAGSTSMVLLYSYVTPPESTPTASPVPNSAASGQLALTRVVLGFAVVVNVVLGL